MSHTFACNSNDDFILL